MLVQRIGRVSSGSCSAHGAVFERWLGIDKCVSLIVRSDVHMRRPATTVAAQGVRKAGAPLRVVTQALVTVPAKTGPRRVRVQVVDVFGFEAEVVGAV